MVGSPMNRLAPPQGSSETSPERPSIPEVIVPSSRITRRTAITAMGLVGLALPGLLESQPSPAPSLEQQTHMRAALEALRSARRHLDMAEADKGGHRVRALVLVNDAITETQAGIAYAAGH